MTDTQLHRMAGAVFACAGRFDKTVAFAACQCLARGCEYLIEQEVECASD